MTDEPLSAETYSNVPEMSVSELSFSLKKTLEDTYGRVRIRGELSRVTVPKSGHLYTDLKDENALINAICWKGTLARLSVKPEEGLEVICTGRVSTYPARSNYQLIIESMELAGEGALLKMLEERRKKLAAEGLFAEERKRALPYLPNVIGVVTSPTGAVIRDIMHRLSDRFPRHVLLWPVRVQGEEAAGEIAAAIRGFSNMKEGGAVPRPDLLIVARGGGSLEDLMPFNEEEVVRAVAECTIPLISAVGHETDTTLIDYVSDKRAPTPTGAAEIAVPRRMDLLAQVRDNEQRLTGTMLRLVGDRADRLEAYGGRLMHPERLLESKIQALDHAGHKLASSFDRILSVRAGRLAELAAHLTHPRKLLEVKMQGLSHVAQSLQHRYERLLEQKGAALTQRAGRMRHPQFAVEAAAKDLKAQTARLSQAGGRLFDPFGQRLEYAGRMLESLSFKSVLNRGYAVVRDAQGQVVTQASQLDEGQEIDIEFKENQHVGAVTEGKTSPKPQKTPKKSKKSTESSSQGKLF